LPFNTTRTGDASPEFIKETLTRACVKTGIFKRRMIHVARRFGALKKYVDFSNVSLRSLIKSFEGTIIFEEALKEVFTKDLDLNELINVFRRIKTGDIKLVEVETIDEPTPVARVGQLKPGFSMRREPSSAPTAGDTLKRLR